MLVYFEKSLYSVRIQLAPSKTFERGLSYYILRYLTAKTRSNSHLYYLALAFLWFGLYRSRAG